jgi:hypothetical protein
MPDYGNGKIYAIRSFKTEQVYVGSTTMSLAHRLGEHRRIHRYYKEGKGIGKKGGCRSSALLDLDDVYIELIENYPCTNKEKLTAREFQIIREMPNCVNKNSGIYTTLDDWKKRNIEHIKEYSKEYEKGRAEQRKQKIVCSCGVSVSAGNISTHKKTKKHMESEKTV